MVNRIAWSATVVWLAGCLSSETRFENSCIEEANTSSSIAAVFPLAVNVDGDLSDDAWTAPGVVFRHVVEQDAYEDGTFEFALVSDGQSLFVGIRIFDGEASGRTRGVPECRDAVEILLGPSESDRLGASGPCTPEGLLHCEDGRFVIDLAAPAASMAYPNTDINLWHLRSVSTRETTVGVDVELAFDLLLPRPVIVEEGTALSFDIGFFDRDGQDACYGSHVRWASDAIESSAAMNEEAEQQRAAFEDPRDWGQVVFCGPPDRSVTPPGLGRLGLNQEPKVSLIEPAAQDVAFVGEPVLLTAEAIDPDGEISRVEFRILNAAGDIIWRSLPDFRAPFGSLWTGSSLDPGQYEVMAAARDNEGAITYSGSRILWLEDKLTDPRPRWRIAIVGDEITANSWQRDSYRRMLWQALTRNGYSVEFLGGRIRGFDGYLPPNPDFDLDYEGLPVNVRAADLRREVGRTPLGPRRGISPQVALIVVGSQDLEAGLNGDELAADLRSVVESMRQINPTVAIFMAELPPNERTPTSTTRAANAAIHAMAADVSREGAPVISVDLYTGYFVGLHTMDGIVPNTAGETFLAERLDAALETFLAGRLPPPVIAVEHTSSNTFEVVLSAGSPGAEIWYAQTSTAGLSRRGVYSEPLLIRREDGVIDLKVWAVVNPGELNRASSATVSTTLEVLVDRSPPQIVDAIAFREDRVLVRFDEPISEASRNDATRFAIDGLPVREVEPAASDRSRVTLTSATALAVEIPHIIEAIGIEDTATPPNVTLSGSEGASLSISIRSTGRGLRGRYFSDLGARDFFREQIDGPISMRWGESTPDASVFEGCTPVGRAHEPCEDIFMIQWTGYLRPPRDGTLAISANVHGHFALKLDGILVLDTKDQMVGHIESQALSVRADTLIAVDAEYAWHARRAPAPSLAGGQIELEWLYEGGEIEVIPAANLYAPRE